MPGQLGYNFSISNELTQIVNLPFRNPDCDSYRPPLLDLFHSYNPSIYSTMVLIMLLSRFSLALPQTKKGMPLIITQIMVILVLIGTNFKIKMLHERIFLNLVLLLLLKSWLIKIISFVCTNRINLLNLK